MIHKNLKIIFTGKELFKIFLIFFGSLFSILFEIVSIGSIPVFVMLITDFDFLVSKLPTFIPRDLIYQTDQNNFIIFASFTLAGIFIIKNVYFFLLIFFQSKLVMQLEMSITNKIFKYYIVSPYIKHLNMNPAIYVRTIESDIPNIFLVITSYLVMIREILVIFFIFFLLIFTDPFISIFSILFLGFPVLIFYFFYRRILKEKGEILVKKSGERIKLTNQSFGGIKETKILHREKFFIEKFFNTNLIIAKIGLFSTIVSSMPRLFLEVSALIAITSTCAVLAMMGRSLDGILPAISLLAISLVRFIPAFNAVTSSLTKIRIRDYSIDYVVDLIKNASTPLIKEKLDKIYKDDSSKIKVFNNDIKLKNISFNYEVEKKVEKKVTVNNINIDIVKGKSVGLIGKSGSGKSTLVDIITGLLEPNSGEILIDGKNINKDKISWQKQIGYVPQDIYLLDDSIRNNITFGIDKEKIDEKLLSEVIEKSQLKNLINSLPKKLETLVGDRGTRLSGGEKQRIGIARALYNKPKVMIFDEATSALDIYNENKILEEIYENKKDKTLIIISHRNNTVKYCDSIYVMEDGKIIDNGSFEKIMQKYDYLKEKTIK